MGWTLGAIEAVKKIITNSLTQITISILVGLSVDYLFHVADAYCNAVDPPGMKLTRLERLRHSLTELTNLF